jgi:hypothetical protein
MYDTAKENPSAFEVDVEVLNMSTVASSGPVTLTVQLPPELTAQSISAKNWSCTLAGLRCTRSDTLAVKKAYADLCIRSRPVKRGALPYN